MFAVFVALALSPATQVSAASAAPPAAQSTGRLLGNGWFYDEIGNSCLAARTAWGARLIINLTRWDDLSDSLLLHRPGLPALWSEEDAPSSLTPAQQEAEEAAGYHLTVRIDGRPVGGNPGFNSMLLDHQGTTGPTYRIGIRQQPFLQALRAGRTLELYRKGRRLAAFPIRGSRDMAARMTRCIDLPARV